MNLLKALKKNALSHSLYDFLNPFTGIIIMLHRVVQVQSVIGDNRQLEITPDFLEKNIQDYKDKGYYFANIDEVYEIQQLGKKIDRPYVCFTFDDGFKDNLMLAYPIFKKYNVPFTVYIATNFPDKTIFVWWYWLENLILKRNELRMVSGEMLRCQTEKEKNEVFLHVKAMIQQLSNEQCRLIIENLFEINDLMMSDELLLLDWNDIRELANSGLCKIGSHGITHTSLLTLDKESLTEELCNSKKILEKQLSIEIKHFAYPFGHCNTSIAKAVKEAGYISAVRVDGGMQRQRQNKFDFKRTILIQ